MEEINIVPPSLTALEQKASRIVESGSAARQSLLTEFVKEIATLFQSFDPVIATPLQMTRIHALGQQLKEIGGEEIRTLVAAQLSDQPIANSYAHSLLDPTWSFAEAVGMLSLSLKDLEAPSAASVFELFIKLGSEPGARGN